MGRRNIAVWCLLAFVALPLYSASAQSAGSGAITGLITDESKAALPGVTVSARSPALQVPQLTVVSAGDGTYRFPALPPASTS